MSYHEVDLNRHSVSLSYGITLCSWALPLEIGVGGSGLREQGVSVSFLCFWFALRWWPRDYAVPESATPPDSSGTAAWLKRFEPERDFGYMLEGLDITAGEMEAMAIRIRNGVDVLRELHDKAQPQEGAAVSAPKSKGE